MSQKREEYVTTGTAREILGISTWKMAEMIKDGTLKARTDPFNKRRKLILKADVVALLEQRPYVVEETKEEDRAALPLAG